MEFDSPTGNTATFDSPTTGNVVVNVLLRRFLMRQVRRNKITKEEVERLFEMKKRDEIFAKSVEIELNISPKAEGTSPPAMDAPRMDLRDP